MKDRYLFPAVFEIGEDGSIGVYFPDLPGCISAGDNEEEAVLNAKEALALHLYGMEEDGDDIPAPSSVRDVQADLDPNEYIVMIEVWMPPFRDKMNQRAIKKTLTIPKWLNDEAEKAGINFSQVLQYALKEKLGIAEKRS
jgi:predicted RNase H-like HicB family nuclease